jgi:TRAP-type C4-dicarboxylate transport system permease small subunit
MKIDEELRMGNFITRSIGVMKIVTKWLAILATVCIAVLMFINIVDIAAAKWFHWAVPGAIDISEELMVFLTLLPIAYMTLERGNINITLVEAHLSSTIRKVLKILQYLVSALASGFLTWRVFVQFQFSYHAMQLKGGIELPIWPANFAIAVSFGFLTLTFLLLLAQTISEFSMNDRSTSVSNII